MFNFEGNIHNMGLKNSVNVHNKELYISVMRNHLSSNLIDLLYSVTDVIHV